MKKNSKWKVMMVDDEQDIHLLTKIVLSKITFMGKKLEFISAHSGAEAKQKLVEHPDTSLVLLDVVMETDDAGLNVAKYIREELKNHFVRIILRTGQPGNAPESRVITEYDINDYREKTELTAQKLTTVVIAGLRSYRDLIIIEANRHALEKIITASTTIMKMNSMKQFASSCLNQLTSILSLDISILYCQAQGVTAEKNSEYYYILAGTGTYEDKINSHLVSIVPPPVLESFKLAIQEKRNLHYDDYYVGYFESSSGSINVVYVEDWETLNDWGKEMISMFCNNIAIAYDNICYKQEIEETGTELFSILGQASETHAFFMGNHIKRVSKYTQLLAKYKGMPQKEIDLLGFASSLHDIGNLQISSELLTKKAPLTEEELQRLREHPRIGSEILQKSHKNILQIAALISLQHQEKYDGSGYPNQLKGEEIHPFSQITTLADVFDSLGVDKPYRKAWPLEKITTYLKEQKGRHFAPDLVDILLNNLEEFLKIKGQYPDPILENI